MPCLSRRDSGRRPAEWKVGGFHICMVVFTSVVCTLAEKTMYRACLGIAVGVLGWRPLIAGDGLDKMFEY